MTLTKQDVPELKSYKWRCDSGFLTDAMSHLNELNLMILQGMCGKERVHCLSFIAVLFNFF